MQLDKLKVFFEKFIKDKSIKSVLIDGKAGIGKSFYTNNFFKNRDNCIIASFFGIDSIEDMILFLSDKIDSSYIINVNDKYLIANNGEDTLNDGIIVFDDLERKNANISFSDIEGLIGSLTRNGFKIVSIINSCFFSDDAYQCAEHRNDTKKILNEFSSFYEKTFDRKIDVTVSEKSLLDIFEGNRTFIDESFLKIANDNLRILLRAKDYYDCIKARFKKLEKPTFWEDIDLDEKRYFRCVLLAIRCVFGTDYTERKFNKDDDFWKSKYDDLAELFRYEMNIVNELFDLINPKSGKAIENAHLVEERIVGLILTYLDADDDCDRLYADYYNVRDDSDILSKAPFNNHIFCLGDTDNIEYKKAFMKSINEFDFSKEKHVRALIDIARYAVAPFSKVEIGIIMDRIKETVDVEQVEELYAQFERNLIMRDYADKNRIQELLNEVKNKFKQSIDHDEFERLTREISNKNYRFLIDYLYENRNASLEHKKEICKKFEAEDYLLPDLSSSINSLIWSYCHEITRFIVGDKENVKKFIDVLVKQYASNPNSVTLKRKCSVLVMQYFNMKFDDFLPKSDDEE